MSVTISQEAIDRALDRLILEVIPEGSLEKRLEQRLELMLGAIPIETAAKLQGWEVVPFRRLMRRHNIHIVHLSHKKASISVGDLQRLIEEHKIPVPKPRKRHPKPQVQASGHPI